MVVIHINRSGCELARYQSWAEYADELRRGHIICEDGDSFVCRDEQAPWRDAPVNAGTVS